MILDTSFNSNRNPLRRVFYYMLLADAIRRTGRMTHLLDGRKAGD